MAVTTAPGAAARTAPVDDRRPAAPGDQTTASIVAAHSARAARVGGVVGIDGDAALAAGQPLEQRAGLAVGDGRPARAPAPQPVTAGRLDPDHIESAGRQEPAAVRAAQRGGQVEHLGRSVGSHPPDRTDALRADCARRGTRVPEGRPSTEIRRRAAGVCEPRTLEHRGAAGRESRRDRHPHHAGGVRARHPDGRRPLRRRRRLAPHPQGRRVPLARTGAARRPTSTSTASSRSPSRPAATPSTRATAS